ncbi:MAG: ATP-binding cassette domain-containing protein [Bacilli bacterium]|nr:ATP-binding cassette domain-containing protein [Bacilli bacterium]
MFNDKVANELVAYKNAKTEYKTLVASRKEKIKFAKGEAKKEKNKVKNEPSLLKSGKLYTLKIEYNGKKSEANEEYKTKIKSLSKEELEAQEATLKAERDDKLVKAKAWYDTESIKIKEEARALKAEVPTKIKEIKENTQKEIDSIKESTSHNKSSLKEKYKPIIKENKAAYKTRCKTAKKEVKQYKKEIKEKYSYRVNYAKSYLSDKNEIKEACKKAKQDYISSIKITKAQAKARALKIMKEVGISNPEKRFKQYPFEFSGGMRQRIVIAIALTANPDILICDEPTTALDVTIQAQILELINRLKEERNISVIFITHDLGVVANMADRVAVMYAGKIVEYGTEDDIFYDPKHPYTWALLSSIPDIDSKEKLEAIPGTPPNMIYPPKGDAFALRSKYAMAIDFKKEPPLFKVSDTHYAATWLLDPRAPKVEMPKIVKTRIENSLKNAKKGASN